MGGGAVRALRAAVAADGVEVGQHMAVIACFSRSTSSGVEPGVQMLVDVVEGGLAPRSTASTALLQ